MIRRKLTLKRIDPWTVLKFGFVVNVAMLIVSLLVFWVVWTAIQRLGLVEQFCGSVGTIVLDLRECSLNFGNIFRTYLFLGMLGVIISTGVMVLASFLYNLIADLTGGLTFTFLDDSGDPAVTTSRKAAVAAGTGAAASGAVAGKATGTATSRDPDATRHSGTPSPGSSGSPRTDRRPDDARPAGDRPGSPSPATAPSPSPSSPAPRTPSTSPGTAPSTSPSSPASPTTPSQDRPSSEPSRPTPGSSQPSPSPSSPSPSPPPQERPSSEPSRPRPGSLWGDSTSRDD